MVSVWYSFGLPCWHLPRSLCNLTDTYINACIYINEFLIYPSLKMHNQTPLQPRQPQIIHHLLNT